MSTISSFKIIENKHDVCSGKNCMKRFCEFIREHTMVITSFKMDLYNVTMDLIILSFYHKRVSRRI